MSRNGKHVKISLSESSGVIVADPARANVCNGDTVVWERGSLQDRPLRLEFSSTPSPANGTFNVDRHGNLSLVMNNAASTYAYVATYADNDDPVQPPVADPPPVIVINDGSPR